MNDSENRDNKPKVLGLKSGTNTVRQSFSHGRSKSVVVETRRKKLLFSKKGPLAEESAKPLASDNEPREDDEILRRKKAIEASKAEEKKLKAQNEHEKAEQQKEPKQKDLTDKINSADALNLETPDTSTSKKRTKNENNQKTSHESKTRENSDKPTSKATKLNENKRRSGKITITQALGEDVGRQRSIASLRRRQEKEKRQMLESSLEREKIIRDVPIPDTPLTVQELANRMAERSADLVKKLMTNGIMVTKNQAIDIDTATLLVEEFGHKAIRVSDSDVEDIIINIDDTDEEIKSPRPAVVTIMGHVDHGKTTLLDTLRETNVVSGEAGGITQHIGAYQITLEKNQKLTFLDTPGHAAFSNMRSRGATITDIVVLVVAADDSVKPQTIEAINHAKEAKVPMIVAINKIDKQGADPNKVRTELLQHGIVVESMSGDVLEAEISATNGTGLEKLLENIILQAELLELKSNEKRPAEGTVVEAKLDMGRGPVATVLVQKGTLKKGDIFVVGQQWGKVRALFNDKKETIDFAIPSTPVEVLGLNGTPEAGDILNVLPSEAKAREISLYREKNLKNKKNTIGMGSSLDQLLAKAKEDEKLSFLPIIVKADVRGSGEAIVQAMEKIKSDEVEVRVVHSGVGAITESDITLALSSNSIIIGFNVRANTAARESASQKNIDIRYYSVIYDLVDDITKAAEGLLSPEIRETFIGYAKIQEVFKITGVGKIAGCLVTEGHAKRDVGVRLLREDVVIHTGKLKTLKRFKDEVKEVQSGQECGMAFEAYEDIRKDDVIEIFTTQEVARTLN
ncbi:MAG: translation initiation factor IF-2 [Paracoccaceae bacterium]|nr:MAG: translation initiation factor IF-2 [Alphaproteobacteria bacterium]